jgi:hypothetical protein
VVGVVGVVAGAVLLTKHADCAETTQRCTNREWTDQDEGGYVCSQYDSETQPWTDLRSGGARITGTF